MPSSRCPVASERRNELRWRRNSSRSRQGRNPARHALRLTELDQARVGNSSCVEEINGSTPKLRSAVQYGGGVGDGNPKPSSFRGCHAPARANAAPPALLIAPESALAGSAQAEPAPRPGCRERAGRRRISAACSKTRWITATWRRAKNGDRREIQERRSTGRDASPAGPGGYLGDVSPGDPAGRRAGSTTSGRQGGSQRQGRAAPLVGQSDARKERRGDLLDAVAVGVQTVGAAR